MVDPTEAAQALRAHLHEGEECPVCKGRFYLADRPQLTTRQEDVLAFWWDYHAQLGMWPTLDEAGSALGISRQTVLAHLVELEAKGYVRSTAPRTHRNWWATARPRGAAPRAESETQQATE